MPSMPVGFWNDTDGTRYRDSYFSTYPGVWRHGDWVTVTDHGSVDRLTADRTPPSTGTGSGSAAPKSTTPSSKSRGRGTR